MGGFNCTKCLLIVRVPTSCLPTIRTGLNLTSAGRAHCAVVADRQFA